MVACLYCHHCKKTRELPLDFVDGAIASVRCPTCSQPSAVRSPRPISEEEMLAELGGDASLLSIEVAPPADGIQRCAPSRVCNSLNSF
jgi:hypothetical protein